MDQEKPMTEPGSENRNGIQTPVGQGIAEAFSRGFDPSLDRTGCGQARETMDPCFEPFLHELCNLVSQIMGYAQLASMTRAERDVQKCIDVALHSSARARDILAEMKSFLADD